VVVLRGGAVAAEMPVDEATDDALGAAMLGGVG
jgi:hypothetical protein